MDIVFVASEMAPFCKTGGLGDVMGALPKTLARMGHKVEVFLPFYDQFMKEKISVAVKKHDLRVQLSTYYRYGDILSTQYEGVEVFFVSSPHFFDRDGMYYSPTTGNYSDNAERFIFFGKSVLEYLKLRKENVDIIHCNDWQSGIIPALLKTVYGYDSIFANCGTVFTIHNIAYQGKFWHFDYRMTNMPQEHFSPDGVEFWGDMSFLKAGVVYADAVTTVSESYAEEIKTEEFGCGMEGVLKAHEKKLSGIVNGVDMEDWNPAIDPHLRKNYSVRSLKGKADCKRDLQGYFHLAEDDVPLFGLVSRFIEQKGLKLIAEIIEEIIALPLQLVLLGTGDKKYEELFSNIARKYPKKVGTCIGFNNALAHQIEAGADFFLMPSLFEPCGLNQMYSLIYGTPPIVRAVGGLNDTVIHYTEPKGNGLKFSEYHACDLLDCIKQAVGLYNEKKKLLPIIKNGMKSDFSWENSATKYLALYKTLQ